MAESVPTPKTKTKSKVRKKASSSPPVPPAGGLVSAWRVWGAVGFLLVGGVIAWRLVGVSFASDIRTICNGEKRSGYTAEKDMAKVTQWVRDHLGTPEGNQFYSALNDAKMLERSKTLQSRASEVGVDPCPMVASFQQVAAEGDYRADLQRLCSRLTFPKLDEMDDVGRIGKVLEWIDQKSMSPRTKELADPLQQAAPGDRTRVLLEAAQKMDVFTCETAKTLSLPQQPPKVKGPPSVRPYSAPQIVGSMSEADFAKSLVDATPALNQCYAAGLQHKPDLEGRMAIKIQIDPNGKVMNVGMADSKVSDASTTQCIMQALREMHAPKNPGPLVSILLPLELTTLTSVAPASSGARANEAPLTLPQSVPIILPSSQPSAKPAPSAH